MKEILDDVVVALFTYNQDKYTRESILSIFNQTVWPRKLMIFDDGSSDYTEEVIKDALKDKPNLSIYLDSLENDVRLNGSESYETYTSDDWEEDFENYMADKMDM